MKNRRSRPAGMKMVADACSNTTCKRIFGGKYNLFKPTLPPQDMSKEYEFRKDGWRRRV